MTSILAKKERKFSSLISIATTNARISVESDRDYWQDNNLPNLVRLTDDHESHMLLSPAEALAVAAALESVAVYIIENEAQGVAA